MNLSLLRTAGTGSVPFLNQLQAAGVPGGPACPGQCASSSPVVVSPRAITTARSHTVGTRRAILAPT